jgi:ethanolamine ammonia-lyase large subunit
MPCYRSSVGPRVYRFDSLKILLAKATPLRSGDQLAGIDAINAQERVAAQIALADLPLRAFLSDLLIPCEEDEVSRLIMDDLDSAAFAPVAHMNVGDFRDWLLSDGADGASLATLASGQMPEMAAAVS